MLFTEYVSFANFIKNPLFISMDLFVWKINYFLDLSIFGMYRMMNIGIALYIIGAIGFPLSQHPRRELLKKGSLLVAIPATLILLADPGLLQYIFKPDNVFQGMQNIYIGLNIMNRLLNYLFKAALVSSIILSLWIHHKIPKIFRKRSQLIIIGLVPIHILVFMLFYWFPSHSIHTWRLATLNLISLPYSRLMATLIFFLSVTSVGVLIYTSIVYNSFEINARRHQSGFKARMKTAGSGLRIFTHSIKNQFIAVKLLAEQGSVSGSGIEQLESIQSICKRTIERLSSLHILPDRISFTYESISTSALLLMLEKEFSDIHIQNTVPNAMVRIDEHYFLEVLRNLITNSKEAVRDCENFRIVLHCDRQLNYIVFIIEDNGKGIEPAIQKHIFEPFFSTKPSISNWGMGLAFAQQLVESFGGAMRVESVKDQYTKMEIYIPEEQYES
ncbi:MAG: HAMP domain-containing histidine kinase [Sphaerochaeta sp.]|nr:HAMP domain-containing histidine kinase [Sphaerochaeta sp.]